MVIVSVSGKEVVEFHPGYHRFFKPLAATAVPAKVDKARKAFIMLKRCNNDGSVQMEEGRSGPYSRGLNEREQKNRSERVLAAMSECKSE